MSFISFRTRWKFRRLGENLSDDDMALAVVSQHDVVAEFEQETMFTCGLGSCRIDFDDELHFVSKKMEIEKTRRKLWPVVVFRT
jgi:hypothetical protein